MSAQEAAAKALFKMVTGGADDVARAADSALPTAVKRIADTDTAPPADDWGWKGGKPGEVTGGQIVKLRPVTGATVSSAEAKATKQLDEQLSSSTGLIGKEYARLKENYDMMKSHGFFPTTTPVARWARDFNDLEKADIPREWTGKVMNSMIARRGGTPDGQLLVPYTPYSISEAMRPLTNTQRDTFISLYPEWVGTLEDLVGAARSLS